VSGIQRYDLQGGPPLTERELKRRWATFHSAIRIKSDTPFRQFIGRMLGENTLRYKTARLFGRPLLRTTRRLRGRDPNSAPREVVAKIDQFFPANYRPREVQLAEEETALEERLNDVEVFEVNETLGGTFDALDSLNHVIATSSRTWLFLHDTSLAREKWMGPLSVLLAAALDDDDVVFADEIGLLVHAPILKTPGIGPHTLLSYNGVGRPALLRLASLRAVGGFSSQAGWAFEHDAYLRLSEMAATFHHVPLIVAPGRPNVSFSPAHIDEDSCRVVRSAFRRRGWRGAVGPGVLGGLVQWTVEPPSPAPSIDIIIPTRDRLDLVLQCIGAVEAQTTYPNYDIVILDNDSKDPATLDYFATTKYRVIACPGPFNYAAIVNRGVGLSTADFVVTLNNDTILITPDWLERMIGVAALSDVGIVGACLIDQDGRHEHESIVISPYPQHLRTDSNYPHQDYFALSRRDVAAVTGAVQMVRREFWQSLGGMDERLRVTMNDVDICLRSQVEGRYVVYLPDVKLFHHVSSSRGKLDPLEDRNLFIQRWDIFGSFQDPYFPESILLLGEEMYFRHR